MNTLKNTHGIAHVYLDGDCDEGIEGYFNLFADDVRGELGARIVIEPPGPRVQYLVCLCCSMDGVPVRLFDTEAETLAFCRETFPAGPFDALGRCGADHPVRAATEVYGQDYSCVIGWEVYRFENGVPTKRYVLWDDAPKDADPAVVTHERFVNAVPEALS